MRNRSLAYSVEMNLPIGPNGSDPTDPPDLHSQQLESTAYHEAGHAVMALSLGREVHRVTIEPGKSQFGEVRLGTCQLGKGRSKSSKDTIEDEVLILLAGMVAEARFTGEYCHQGARQDIRMAARLLQTRAGSERQLERLQRRLLNKTEHVLHEDAHVSAIEWIASELMQRQTVSGRTVRHYFKQAMQQSSNQ
ncbi:MAG: cell division protein FtsH [Rubripirellula sp.]